MLTRIATVCVVMQKIRHIQFSIFGLQANLKPKNPTPSTEMGRCLVEMVRSTVSRRAAFNSLAVSRPSSAGKQRWVVPSFWVEVTSPGSSATLTSNSRGNDRRSQVDVKEGGRKTEGGGRRMEETERQLAIAFSYQIRHLFFPHSFVLFFRPPSSIFRPTSPSSILNFPFPKKFRPEVQDSSE